MELVNKLPAENSKNFIPTCGGAAALFLWSLSALAASELTRIPTLQLMGTTLTLGSIFSLWRIAREKKWEVFKQNKRVWLTGILGIGVNQFSFMAMFKHAPAVQADMINYLWPLFVMLFSGFLPKERFTPYHLVAALIGFAGIYFLIAGEGGLGEVKQGYVYGYALAFCAAFSWSMYTLFLRGSKSLPIEMTGLFCGCIGLIALALHFLIEETAAYTSGEMGRVLLLGLLSNGLAYFLWDRGIKRGKFKFLGILSYCTPLLSVFWLISLGRAEMPSDILLSCGMIFSASAIGLNSSS